MKPTTGEGVAPQCTTAAQCLKELARVMEQFGIASPTIAIEKYGRWEGRPINNAALVFSVIVSNPEALTLAIAEVEGKPVFLYNELFDSHECKWMITTHAEGYLYAEMSNGIRREFDPKLLSWNPPKPKTVMVEMTVEDAEYLSSWSAGVRGRLEGACTACKLALEKLK